MAIAHKRDLRDTINRMAKDVRIGGGNEGKGVSRSDSNGRRGCGGSIVRAGLKSADGQDSACESKGSKQAEFVHRFPFNWFVVLVWFLSGHNSRSFPGCCFIGRYPLQQENLENLTGRKLK